MRNLIAVLFIALFCVQAFALPAATIVYEVRTTGASTNGGGWNTSGSGTDWSQQDACKYSLSGLTSSGAGSIILTASAASDWVGNVIHVTSGTNFTAGFFEITSISAGVSATVSTNQAGTAVATGVGASGVACIGGAFKFGTSQDPIFAAGIAPGNTVWIKSGSYPSMSNSMLFTDCTVTKQCFYTGYTSSRGDITPTTASTNFPLLNLAGTSNDFGAVAVVQGISFTSTATTPLSSDGQTTWFNIKSVNTSLSSGRSALNPSGGDRVINSELVSQAGNALNFNSDVYAIGNYIHDSPTCIKDAANGFDVLIANNIIAGCPTNNINVSAANLTHTMIIGNTIYGSERKDGVGINVATGNSDTAIINNVFYGLATGISAATANTANFALNNDFNNNTTARTNWAVGTGDISTSPAFLGAATVSGTAGVVSSATLTDSGASMTNVVDGRDYLVIISGSAVTTAPSSQLISSHTSTSVTVPTAIGGSGTNISYFIQTGHNFAPGAAMANLAMPTTFPAALTTNYGDIGAVHTQNTDPGVANVLSTATYTFQNGSKTGTYVGPTIGQVQTGVSYGVSLTGTYDGSDRWTDPGISNVKKGVTYKANSTTNNRTGTKNSSHSGGGFGAQ